MQIRRIDVDNFRGIQSASWRLPKHQRFFALIGPGDATKTTLLSAIERALHDRAGLAFADTDFHNAAVDDPIRIRVAVTDLPDELITLDAFGANLAGIDDNGEWTHDPDEGVERCVIVELLVEADLEPVWQTYRPPTAGDLEADHDPRPVRAKHRAAMAAYRVDDRVDAHLRWSSTSSLGKLATQRGGTKSTLTAANRAARDAVTSSVSDELKTLAQEIQAAGARIGAAAFRDLKPGLDTSLFTTRGNLALFEGDVPLTNFGLGTRRLTGVATQQLANDGSTTLLIDEVEYGLEPHRLAHLLTHLRQRGNFSQVFVTTHSPTALRHLDPADLVIVRSGGSGTTHVQSLTDPPALRPVLMSNPEAFLARRVVLNEGKTEYGVVLELIRHWDQEEDAVPAAALGVVPLEGDGGTGSAKWAGQLLDVGYDVVLFMDSDDAQANACVPDVVERGGAVVQWSGDHSIESAVCSQLDASGLTAFIAAALEVADDEEDAARQSFSDRLRAAATAAGQTLPAGTVLHVSTWIAAGIPLDDCRSIVATTSSPKGKNTKAKGWFKRVDKGERLARFILATPALQVGPVAQTLEALKHAIYQPLISSPIRDAETTDPQAVGSLPDDSETAVDGSSTGSGTLHA